MEPTPDWGRGHEAKPKAFVAPNQSSEWIRRHINGRQCEKDFFFHRLEYLSAFRKEIAGKQHRYEKFHQLINNADAVEGLPRSKRLHGLNIMAASPSCLPIYKSSPLSHLSPSSLDHHGCLHHLHHLSHLFFSHCYCLHYVLSSPYHPHYLHQRHRFQDYHYLHI